MITMHATISATSLRAVLTVIASVLLTVGPTVWAQHTPTLAHLPWMIGCWANSDAEPGTSETWRVSNDGSMIGFGRISRGEQVVTTERMRIEKSADGNLVFIASPAGQDSTRFVIVNIADDEVVFENRQHDYPQRIIYRLLSVDRMLARIEGVVDGVAMSKDFHFQKVECEN